MADTPPTDFSPAAATPPKDVRAAIASIRGLADAMPQLVWICLPDGSIEYLNRRWYEYTGQPTGTFEWLRYLHPDDADHARAVWEISVSSGEPYEIEYRMLRADGEFRWHLARGVPTRDDAGHVVRWFGTCTDIHDRKTAEQKLQQAKDDSDSAGRAKDEFLSIISHELRTPLSAILGWTQLLEMGVLDAAETADAVQTIKQQAKAQSQLIEDLLDVSRILNGKFHLRLTDCDIRRAVAAAVHAAGPVAKNNDVTLRHVDGDGPLVVRGDPQRLQQVVTNLINNAIKFTPKDGTIDVSVDSDSGAACVRVVDSGTGIPVDQIEEIFERFKQIGGEALRDKGGLGLGLSIVKHVVDAHDGTVRVASDGVGRGSRFEMRIPRAAAAASVEALAHPSPDAHADADALRGVRVLVVDDEASARNVIAAALRKSGAEVYPAGDAAEAWDTLNARPVDVLVSDLSMPGHSGIDLIGRVRGSDKPFKGVKAIALTGFASVDDQTRALAAGFAVHVSKPVEPSELIRRIAGLTRTPNSVPSPGTPGEG